MRLKNYERVANKFLKENYGLELRIPIFRNNRLRRAMGVYKTVTIDNTPCSIELSGQLLDYATEKVIDQVLKHELIHYALHVLGRPYKDGHPIFENELVKHNSITSTKKIGEYFLLECDSCGERWETKRKRAVTHTHEYRSRCCDSSISYIKNVYYNGERKI